MGRLALGRFVSVLMVPLLGQNASQQFCELFGGGRQLVFIVLWFYGRIFRHRVSLNGEVEAMVRARPMDRESLGL